MHPQPTTPCDPRALSNFKHGLTGRIYLFGEAEQAAYDKLCASLRTDLAPEGALQTELIQQICDDRWRMLRASQLENSIFAEAIDNFTNSEESTGNNDLDTALAQGRAWLAEAKNLNLLTLYESRIQRRFEKNMAELHRLQTERKAALEAAIEEAALLSHLAESKGEGYDPAEAFLTHGFEFSPEEIARRISRWRRLLEAKSFMKSSLKPAQKPLRRAA